MKSFGSRNRVLFATILVATILGVLPIAIAIAGIVPLLSAKATSPDSGVNVAAESEDGIRTEVEWERFEAWLVMTDD